VADDRLSPDDARILAVESPVVMGHTLKLNVLEPGAPLDLDELQQAISARLDSEPRATQRVDTDGPEPRWVAADDFDIRDHVRRHEADRTATRDDLWRAVSGLMSEHLDRDKPLWTFDVIGPFDDGSEAIAARIHHAMADGIAAVEFLHSLLWDRHEEPPAKTAKPAPVDERSELVRLPGALLREFGHRASRTPFDRPLTAARELAFAVAPLAELKAIGAARPDRATVNDVLLAIVAGGLRDWLGVPDDPRRRLRAQVPVSLHSRGDGLGNHDSFMNVDLPLGEADPIARLDGIRSETAARKQLDDADEIYDLMHALGRVTHVGHAARRLTNTPREFSVSISNVPGPRVPVSVAGRGLRLFTSSEPALHHALRISAISCAGEVSIGLCTDPSALSDIARLAAAIERAYDELHTATV
jgi:diacylglycerol O-acyltransferase / wax synthase